MIDFFINPTEGWLIGFLENIALLIELCDKAIILDRGDQVKIINRGEKDFNEKYFKQLL